MTTTNSKIGRSVYHRWINSSYDELYKAHGKCSAKKQEAWEYCKRICGEKNGSDLKIIGSNNYHFSAAFRYEENGESFLMHITVGGNRPIRIV